MSRTLGRRTGERKQQVLEFTEQAGKLVQRSIREAKRLVVIARRRARGRGAKPKLRQVRRLETFVQREERATEQIRKRMRGERIIDRPISIFDPHARPIHNGKLGKPNEFGFLAQTREVTENTNTGARGVIIPAACGQLGNPAEDTPLPDTVAELQPLGIQPREVALDGGFNIGPTAQTLETLEPERTFIASRQQPGSRRTQPRLARYRTGSEGRISHLKRGYGMRRSRLKDHDGMQTSTGWSILTHNLDTLAIRTSRSHPPARPRATNHLPEGRVDRRGRSGSPRLTRYPGQVASPATLRSLPAIATKSEHRARGPAPSAGDEQGSAAFE
jgi:IS5 family transposase